MSLPNIDSIDKRFKWALLIGSILTLLFLAAAALRGNQTVNGLGMLLHQGVPAWQRWFDLTPEVTPELQSLMEQSLTA